MDVTVLANRILAASASDGRLLGLTMGQLVLASVCVLLATLLVGEAVRRRIRTTWSPPLTTPDAPASAVDPSTVAREIETVMDELDRVSRHLHQRLDAKVALLEGLVHEADDRIDRLSRAVRSTDGERTLDVTLHAESPTADSTPSDGGPHAAIYRLADNGRSSLDIARELGRPTGEIELILALRRAKAEPVRSAAR